MKKYKLLKDLLCFKKGEVHTMDIISISFSPKEAASMCPDSFKDWFEEIKGPSDEEMVTNFINKYDIETIEEAGSRSWNIGLAKALLAKGFKAEWVKECEHDWGQYAITFRDFPSLDRGGFSCNKCGARE